MAFRSLPSLLLLAFILYKCSKESSACWAEEKTALLEIKASFSVPGRSEKWPLKYWDDDADCCRWERVTCDSVTGRVTHLLLNQTWGYDYGKYQFNLLNSTLFLPFRDLQYLDLSENSIDGCIPNSEFEAWSSLRKLKVLDLSGNYFNESIIESLIRVSSLKTLFLSENYMANVLQIKELSKLNLEVLDLSSTYISGALGDLGNWPSLKALSLYGNSLNGTLPTEELCKMINLKELDLSQNELTGDLPSCIGNLTSLTFLDLSQNQFQIKFPNSIFTNMTSLKHLSLSRNQLEGILHLNSFSSHSKLKILKLSSQSNKFRVETEFPMANPSFQLEGLELRNCSLNNNYNNNHTGIVPSFLLNRYELYYLDLSHNNLGGSFPNLLVGNNSPKLITLDIRGNNFSRTIPNWINESFLLLRALLLGENHFDGTIPDQICDLKYLLILDLSHNSLSGKIPTCLSKMGSHSFRYLDYSESGGGPFLMPNYESPLTNHPKMYETISIGLDQEEFMTKSFSDYYEFMTKSRSDYYQGEILNYCLGIDLSSNLLEGSIPEELGSMNWMSALNISNNRLTGKIPKSLSNLTNLESLDLTHNDLTGQIPTELAKLHFLGSFSVAYNNLSGAILNGGQFATFANSSFEGNPNLCGPPLVTSCAGDVPSDSLNEDGTGNSMKDDWFDLVVMVASFVVPYIIGFWGFIYVIYYKRNWNRALFLAAMGLSFISSYKIQHEPY